MLTNDALVFCHLKLKLEAKRQGKIALNLKIKEVIAFSKKVTNQNYNQQNPFSDIQHYS